MSNMTPSKEQTEVMTTNGDDAQKPNSKSKIYKSKQEDLDELRKLLPPNQGEATELKPNGNETKKSNANSKVYKAKQEDLNHLRKLLQDEHIEIHFNSKSMKSGTKSIRNDPSSAPSSAPSSLTSCSDKSDDEEGTEVDDDFLGSQSVQFFACLSIHFSLSLLFLVMLVVLSMRSIHDDYYVPIIERATRTDDDLLDEFTYYERPCTAEDVTSGFEITNNTKDALNHMMTHGAVLIPKLLSPVAVHKLRRFIKRKNKAITAEEEFPVSQGYKRLSYGIEATEDEAVIEALKEITSHYMLPDLLETILGSPDPALTEITAITAYYGSGDQAIHSDVKADGNGVKYARTYSHSYSLFIPVQDVTTQMGVTTVCPGTQYCANDLSEVCEEQKIGMNGAYQKDVWKAGDGAMLNQQVWHGGSAHTDPRAPERIVFIVSFIARPQLGTDQRQLSRGTFFHMKWNVWGHTMRDISIDLPWSMEWPRNYLRSLALWKPSQSNWGYDLLLSAALRLANGQPGMDEGDLETFINLKMDRLFHIPKFLQGSFSYDGDAWQVYMRETFEKCTSFLKQVTVGAHAAYFVGLAIYGLTSVSNQSVTRLLNRSFWRFVMSHGVMAYAAWYSLSSLRSSKWGSDIIAGKTLMRPFPSNELRGENVPQWVTADPAVISGPTTFPERMDVLVGSRFDAKYLGSYNRWLDYHPGNTLFRRLLAERDYSTIVTEGDSVLLQRLVEDMLEEFSEEDGGRFLQQDYRGGEWRVMTDTETKAVVTKFLVSTSNELVAQLIQDLNFIKAEYRFGAHRLSTLARDTLALSADLESRLLRSFLKSPRSSFNSKKPESSGFKPSYQPSLVASTNSGLKVESGKTSKLKEETTVMVFDQQMNTWVKGRASMINETSGYCTVSFDAGMTSTRMLLSTLRKPTPLSAGSRVQASFDGSQFEGSILWVYPNGDVDLLFDDGYFASGVKAGEFTMLYPPLF